MFPVRTCARCGRVRVRAPCRDLRDQSGALLWAVGLIMRDGGLSNEPGVSADPSAFSALKGRIYCDNSFRSFDHADRIARLKHRVVAPLSSGSESSTSPREVPRG